MEGAKTLPSHRLFYSHFRKNVEISIWFFLQFLYQKDSLYTHLVVIEIEGLRGIRIYINHLASLMSTIVSDNWSNFRTQIFLVRLYAKITESSGCYTADSVSWDRALLNWTRIYGQTEYRQVPGCMYEFKVDLQKS